MSNSSEKVALITGASSGIGAAVAERLARDGFAVIVNYAGNAAAAEAPARQLETAGGRAIAARADVADPNAVREMFDRIDQTFGRIDAVVNNAGIMQLASISEADDALFDRHIAVNRKGTFNVMREAGKRLGSGGRIVNFSSSVTRLLHPTYGIYAGTKAAVEAMTTVMVKEMRGRGITVNAVAPGPTASKLFLDGKSPQLIDRLAKRAPLERLGSAADIAAAVSFLVGADGGWINGQTLRANGGII